MKDLFKGFGVLAAIVTGICMALIVMPICFGYRIDDYIAEAVLFEGLFVGAIVVMSILAFIDEQLERRYGKDY